MATVPNIAGKMGMGAPACVIAWECHNSFVPIPENPKTLNPENTLNSKQGQLNAGVQEAQDFEGNRQIHLWEVTSIRKQGISRM